MPYREQEPKRLYWRIGDVAKLIDEPVATVRYWLKKFKIRISKRQSNGERMINPAEIRIIQAVQHLVRVEKYTLDGADVRLQQWIKGEITLPTETFKSINSD